MSAIPDAQISVAFQADANTVLEVVPVPVELEVAVPA
jgi:hypothetical protein